MARQLVTHTLRQFEGLANTPEVRSNIKAALREFRNEEDDGAVTFEIKVHYSARKPEGVIQGVRAIFPTPLRAEHRWVLRVLASNPTRAYRPGTLLTAGKNVPHKPAMFSTDKGAVYAYGILQALERRELVVSSMDAQHRKVWQIKAEGNQHVEQYKEQQDSEEGSKDQAGTASGSAAVAELASGHTCGEQQASGNGDAGGNGVERAEA